MNVCIKCGRCPLALETYHKMRQEGCAANVVTYNTLIDVYGKMGQWEQANKIPSIMKGEVSCHSPWNDSNSAELPIRRQLQESARKKYSRMRILGFIAGG